MRNNKYHTARNAESFMPDDTASGERTSAWDMVSLDEAVETDDPSKREGGTHLKYGEPRLLPVVVDSFLTGRLRIGCLDHLLPNLLRRAVLGSESRVRMRGQLCRVLGTLCAVRCVGG